MPDITAADIIRLVNYVIFNAVKEGASDIHVEAAERSVDRKSVV